MVLTRRHLRLALLAGLGWILAESILFWLTARQIGFFPTLLFLTGKGVIGFFLLAANLRTILGRVALKQWRHGLGQLGSASFAALGAFLIFLPGFLTTLAGLALFSHSVRAGVVRWLKREKTGRNRDEIITLDANEWREIGRRKPRRRTPKSPTVVP